MTCTSTKCKLTSLIPGTTYYIKIAAASPKGQITYSDIVSKKAAKGMMDTE
ncbi:MAG: fibronectin type III domain-containing protein [Chitinophagales bacterium]